MPRGRRSEPHVEVTYVALPVFARDRGVVLRLIAEDSVAVGFHEAARKGAETLRPSGVCAICRNRTKFRPSTTKQRDLPYIVMDSRGRPSPATSAVDIVVRTGTPVLAPITGTVRNVKRYRLYRRYPDIRVAIAPDADPGRRVVLIHLRGGDAATRRSGGGFEDDGRTGALVPVRIAGRPVRSGLVPSRPHRGQTWY